MQIAGVLINYQHFQEQIIIFPYHFRTCKGSRITTGTLVFSEKIRREGKTEVKFYHSGKTGLVYMYSRLTLACL